MHLHLKDSVAFRTRMMASALLAGGLQLERRDEPTVGDLKKTIDGIGVAVEAMRKKNDEKLADLEKRGAADAVTTEELKKIQAEVTELRTMREEIEKLRTKSGRPGGKTGEDGPSKEQREHRHAFLGMLRNPNSQEHRAKLAEAERACIKAQQTDDVEQRAIDTTAPGTGGYAVPEQISTTLEKNLLQISPLRDIVDVVQAGSKDYKQLVDVNGTAYAWVGETGTRSATATPSLEEVAPTFGMIYAYPTATEESLSDMFFDVEAWLQSSMADAFASGEENAIVNGNGTNKPTGFLTGTPVVTADATRAFGVLQMVKTGQAADWKATTPFDTFMQTIYTLKKGYRANARWLMNKATAGEAMLFKDLDNNYMWQMSVLEGQPDRLMGYPVSESEEMPDKAANAFPVAFGDFKAGYLLCDLVGLRITRDEITVPGYVKWYVRRRLGGKIKKSEAIKLIKVAA